MTHQELKTTTARLTREVTTTFFATVNAEISPRARHEIFNAMKALECALLDLEATPPHHGRLGEHDVRD